MVRGPRGELYMIDHHHLTRALFEIGVKSAYVAVLSDWSRESKRKFWQKMIEKKFTYLIDSNGKAIDPADLPQHIEALQDDPHRSLAYFVREQNGFTKSKKPFSEFA